MHHDSLLIRRTRGALAALAFASLGIAFNACVGNSSGVSSNPDASEPLDLDGAVAADGAVTPDSRAPAPEASTDATLDAPATADAADAADAPDTAPAPDSAEAADAADASTEDVLDAATFDATDAATFDAADAATFDAADGALPETTDFAARIYYTRPPDGDAGNALGSIWYIDATGEHRVVEGYAEIVSPDGRYMLYHGPTGNSGSGYFSAREDIWLYDLSLGTRTDLFHNGDYTVGFDFTNDSPYRVVFDNECGIYVMNLDGSSVTGINGSNCYNDEPNVRQSDGLVVFHDYNVGSSPSIYTMTLTGADVAGIANTSSDYPDNLTYSTVWSPGGGEILFDQISSTSSIYGDYYVIGADGGLPTQLTYLLGDAGPDSGIPLLPDGGVPPQGMTYRASWSPDGAHVIFGGSVRGTVGLFALDLPPTGAGPYALPLTGEIDWVGAATNSVPPVIDAGALDAGGD